MSMDTEGYTGAQFLTGLPDQVAGPLRLGRRAATAGRRVHMPRGPLGFPEHHDFALADLPEPDLDQFKLLRSLEDGGPTLIVTPLPAACGLIAREDLLELAGLAGEALEEAVFLLVVRVHREAGPESMSVNLRAPIVFNPETRLARQCVSGNSDYRIRHPFFGWASSGRPRRGR